MYRLYIGKSYCTSGVKEDMCHAAVVLPENKTLKMLVHVAAGSIVDTGVAGRDSEVLAGSEAVVG